MIKPKTNHFITMRGHTNVQRSNGRKYSVRNNRDRFFFPDEWCAFYDQLREKQKVTFEFLINTGARIMEAQHVQVADIDFERNNIVLRVTKRIVNRPGKQKFGVRKIRVLTISDQFAKFLKKTIRKYKLNPTDTLPILSTPAANIALKKALQKAGVEDYDMFSIHNIRKTLETWLMALGIDSFKIIKHFGHSFAVAAKHYVSADIFDWDDKKRMRDVIGDLFQR